MRKIKYLNEQELRQFFDVVKKKGNVRNELLFKLIFHLGLRVSEALSLKLGDFHSKLIEAKVERLKNGISRTLPLCAEDIKLLKRWREKRKEHKYAEVNPYLFLSSHSTIEAMKKANVQKMFADFAKEAGLDKTNVHSLRHSCAVNMLMNGMDIYTVKNWLGHNNLQSTMVYVKIAPPEWKKLSTKAVESFSV